MIEFIEDLYVHSGEWGDPIVISAAVLFVAGWFMLFTVRLVKRFVIYTILALVLPNAIGVVGYIDEAGDLRGTIVSRGEAMSDELEEAMEDMTFSPLYLGFLGSIMTAAVGGVGIIRAVRKKN